MSRVPQNLYNQITKFHDDWIRVKGDTSNQAALVNRFQQPDEQQVQNSASSESPVNHFEIYKDDSAPFGVLKQSTKVQIHPLGEGNAMSSYASRGSGSSASLIETGSLI